ncbi:uncharacterized protein BJ171DRAFT_41514 [Polychytrium aggregatum]|uniref:uncharacterized protein n=1 Tax=Polychytrium aggregatum TaxID=110093 RepID=UPI0022FF1916|nr:uncharacterized protein BJ171DRAFT_41514 [Polychytrium aggregatum]KAI9206115.1 hypothetical protein BJ171DRAFT_41514 [Polychytrium aggregatum]
MSPSVDEIDLRRACRPSLVAAPLLSCCCSALIDHHHWRFSDQRLNALRPVLQPRLQPASVGHQNIPFDVLASSFGRSPVWLSHAPDRSRRADIFVPAHSELCRRLDGVSSMAEDCNLPQYVQAHIRGSNSQALSSWAPISTCGLSVRRVALYRMRRKPQRGHAPTRPGCKPIPGASAAEAHLCRICSNHQGRLHVSDAAEPVLLVQSGPGRRRPPHGRDEAVPRSEVAQSKLSEEPRAWLDSAWPSCWRELDPVITVVDVEGFTPWTACAPNLASLSLHFCTSSMVALLVPWFAAHPLLTQLELHFNDSLGQVAVPPHLFDSTAALRRLVLSGACMGWKDVTALSKSLPKLEQLTLKTSSVQLSSAFKHEANGLVGGLILALRILAPSTALASIELVDVSIQPVDDYIPTWLHLQDQGDIEFPGLTKVKVDEGERQILEQEDFSFLSTRLPSLQTLSLALSHLRLPGSIFSSDVLLDMIENLSKYADLISLTLQNFATTGLKCRPQLESPTAGRTQSLCGRMKELRLNLFPSIPASLLRLLLFGDKWSSLTSLILLGTDWDNNADELPPVEFPHLKSLQLLEKPLHGHCLLRHIAKSARNLRVLSVLTPGLFPTQTMAALASDTPNITYFTLDQGILEVDAFEMLSRQWKGLKHVHIEGAGLEILGKKPWLQGLLPFLETHRFLMSLVVTADLYPVCAERLIALAQLEASRQTILERTGRLGETGQEIAPIYKDGRVQVCPRSPNQKQRRDRCVPDGDDSDSSMLDEVGFEDCSMAVDHNPGIGSDSPVVDVEMHDSATTDQRQHPSPSKDGSLNEGQRDNADPMAMVSRDGRLGSAAGRADREATEPEEPEETARRLRSYLRTRFPWIECLDVRKRRPTQSQIYGLPAFESGLVRR